MPLSDRDRSLLDFEARWNGHGAAKEEAIRRELALSPARYYQLLARVIDERDAAAHAAQLVHRLRRLRDERARERARRSAVPHAATAPGLGSAGGAVRTGTAR